MTVESQSYVSDHCNAGACRFPSTFEDGRRKGARWCCWHFHARDREDDIPRISGVLMQHAGTASEVCALMWKARHEGLSPQERATLDAGQLTLGAKVVACLRPRRRD